VAHHRRTKPHGLDSELPVREGLTIRKTLAIWKKGVIAVHGEIAQLG
jgi:hypothetical protein